jgi:trimethylamine--corrinoid protein Co-methyltransferase
MRSAICLAGAAECSLMAYAGARLAAFYELPSASWMCTDSFIDDEQASMEKVLTGLPHVLGGVNVIWGMGQLQSEKALSPVQLVMDQDVAAQLDRYWRGFEVSDETLAYDVVRDVVEGGQQFIMHDHTMKHFRDETLMSDLLARTTWEGWEAAGSRSLAERASERVEAILAEPAEPRLSDQQRKDLAAIEQKALASIG